MRKIISGFPSSFPRAERKFFAKMVKSLSLQGLPPAQCFGYMLKCVNGRPVRNDAASAGQGEPKLNEGAWTAVENMSLLYLNGTLFAESGSADLNLMIAVHSPGNAAVSIRYKLEENDRCYSGALFVSCGRQSDSAVIGAALAFMNKSQSQVFLSLSD